MAQTIQREGTMQATAQEGISFLQQQRANTLLEMQGLPSQRTQDQPGVQRDNTSINNTAKEGVEFLARTAQSQQVGAAPLAAHAPQLPRDGTMQVTAREGQAFLATNPPKASAASPQVARPALVTPQSAPIPPIVVTNATPVQSPIKPYEENVIGGLSPKLPSVVTPPPVAVSAIKKPADNVAEAPKPAVVVAPKPAADAAPKTAAIVPNPSAIVVPKPTAVVSKPAAAVVPQPATVVPKPAAVVVPKPAPVVPSKPAPVVAPKKPVPEVVKPVVTTTVTDGPKDLPPKPKATRGRKQKSSVQAALDEAKEIIGGEVSLTSGRSMRKRKTPPPPQPKPAKKAKVASATPGKRGRKSKAELAAIAAKQAEEEKVDNEVTDSKNEKDKADSTPGETSETAAMTE